MGRERRIEPTRQQLFESVSESIARRVISVCAGMPEEEFRALVRQMAMIEIKYAQRREEQLYRGPLDR